MIPENLKYSKDHEWVSLENGVATMGITDHAQKELGDITFVELPDVGSEFDEGADMAVIESVKAAADVYAPLTGKISEVNSELENSPELVNDSPYEQGWICRLEGVDESQYNALMDASAYQEFINNG